MKNHYKQTKGRALPRNVVERALIQVEQRKNRGSMAMKWGKCRLGRLKVNGEKYTKDVIVDRGEVRKRKKKPSREYREQFGHTPVSLKEEIPWECKRLVIGTGMEGRLPVMP